MCSISGFIKTPKQTISKSLLTNILSNASSRGRDSFGMFSVRYNLQSNNNTFVIGTEQKTVDKEKIVSEQYIKEIITKLDENDDHIGIANHRAEPTTEFVVDKKERDVQPFSDKSKRFFVAHNGVIANDKELKEKYNLETETNIDTAVIPELLAKKLDGVTENTFEKIKEIFQKEIKGSYAIAIYDVENPDDLILLNNYKPLALLRGTDTAYFTSLSSFFNNKTNGYQGVTYIPAYSATKISITDNGLTYRTQKLRLEKEGKKKCLVVCSGGLDSSVVATYMKEVKGYDITLLHFKYKCRAEEQEIKAVKDVAEALAMEVLFVETDIFKSVIKHSPLLDDKTEVKKGDAGVEFAHEWIPARNLIMLSMATGIAEAQGFDVIALGNNLEESGAYPDNEEIFIEKFAEILPFAVNVDKEVKIEMPVGNLMKHEIVKLGIDLKAPLDKTWSCYEAGEKHCGECGPCRMRKVGFQMNNTPEVIDYEK